jgi:hypothetical protein
MTRSERRIPLLVILEGERERDYPESAELRP